MSSCVQCIVHIHGKAGLCLLLSLHRVKWIGYRGYNQVKVETIDIKTFMVIFTKFIKIKYCMISWLLSDKWENLAAEVRVYQSETLWGWIQHHRRFFAAHSVKTLWAASILPFGSMHSWHRILHYWRIVDNENTSRYHP